MLCFSYACLQHTVYKDLMNVFRTLFIQHQQAIHKWPCDMQFVSRVTLLQAIRRMTLQPTMGSHPSPSDMAPFWPFLVPASGSLQDHVMLHVALASPEFSVFVLSHRQVTMPLKLPGQSYTKGIIAGRCKP